ncbi:hypothetical protein [Phreatobacter stygius]|uniref:Uncharacterized protein n=1 Tax=Phreatobacter stygius TaxID=1940610 RepID=A0A4D7B0Y4_9HYPH|nr:hypothetical protein [Phreatobacter stygius]QCI67294.1 hypothetical protein E8M01_25540 [Phreatobacter stygius]
MSYLVNLLFSWAIVFVFVLAPTSFVGALVAWLVPSRWRALPVLGLVLLWPTHLAVNFGADPKLGQPRDIFLMWLPPVLLAMMLGVWLVNWIRRLPR